MKDHRKTLWSIGSLTRDDRLLLVAGAFGLVVAAFIACGGDDDDSTQTQDAGASTDSGSEKDSASTGTSNAADCGTTAATASNTAAVVAAANAFLESLTSDQRVVARVERTQANAIQWSNFPAGVVKRNGVRIADMSEGAVSAALALAEVAAGSTGSTMLSEVRAADDAFRTSSGDESLFGDGQYYFSVHGTPSTSSDWMLQIAGHHLAYNLSYNAKCTSATPLFDGAQPAKWTDDNDKAHDPLATQRDAMAALYASVSSITDAKLSGTFSDMLNGPAAAGGGTGMGMGMPMGTMPSGTGTATLAGGTDSKYPASLTYPTTDRGASVATFSSAQKTLVKNVIEAWVKNSAEPIANALLAEYESDDALANTYVGYSGAADLSTTLSYGRIDGPRVWIEFTVQEGTTDGMAGHYHTIWRDKAADYGADLVSQ